MIKAELYRLFCSKRLYLAFLLVIISVILCNISDLSGAIELMSVDFIFDSVTAEGWFRKIIFTLGTGAIAVSYCEDAEFGFCRFIQGRTSKLRYAASKVFVSAFVTFIIMVLALIAVCGILSLFFPICQNRWGNYINLTGVYAPLISANRPFVFFAARIFLFSLGTAVYAMIALAVSTIKPDYYITISVPFVVSFLFERLDVLIPRCFSVDACLSGAVICRDWTIAGNFLYAMFFLTAVLLLNGMIVVYKLQGEKENER